MLDLPHSKNEAGLRAFFGITEVWVFLGFFFDITYGSFLELFRTVCCRKSGASKKKSSMDFSHFWSVHWQDRDITVRKTPVKRFLHNMGPWKIDAVLFKIYFFKLIFILNLWLFLFLHVYLCISGGYCIKVVWFCLAFLSFPVEGTVSLLIPLMSASGAWV